MIKSSVKVNVCHIDKVVVVCSGRIEGQHAQAVQQFMKWLKYKKHRNQFVFVYNKADHCDGEEEKMENVKGMLELLGAKQVLWRKYFWIKLEREWCSAYILKVSLIKKSS